MKNYLFEVGTENLPVDFQSSAEIQLKERMAERLKEERLTFENIKTYSTPRRLSMLITQLQDKQTDKVKQAKGPPANVAFKDGSPTKAAEGFAKRCNVSVDQLKTEMFDNTEYVVARVEEKGKTSEEVLQQVLPDVILGLKGSHFMRWEDLDVRFSRPIRWMTSVMDDTSLPVTIADVTSTDCSVGHRFLHPDQVKISSINEYKDKLKQAFVLVDPEERKQIILKQINELAQKLGGKVIYSEKLLHTVNNLVEWPVAIVGEFDKEYLEIPKEVITTVMSAHQKYFPVFNADGSKLLNYFICVNNKNGAFSENIVKGNQRVLKARLEDGAFYYNEDRKHTLDSKKSDLIGITFQKGLGNMYEKTERIKVLAEYISEQLKLSDKEKANIFRAAELCKADLTTFMVREFTELEGVIGGVYALKDNEDPEVSKAISQHYLPRSAEDNIPDTISGKVVSIADKIDTIVSVFAIGKSPTGSADPLGLRRAALGTMLIILKSELKINISELINKAFSLLSSINRKKEESEIIPLIKEFIIQRLRVYLNEQKYRYDAIDAVLDSGDPLSDVFDTIERLKTVEKLVNEPDFTPFHESANRLLRILKGTEIDFNVNESLFVHDSEKAFYQAIKAVDANTMDYSQVTDKLKAMTPVVEKFFDDVLVMDKDEKIKNNRLSLVYEADQRYKILADFSKVVD